MVYVVVEGIITVTGTNGANRRNRMLNFKNNVPFRSCISKFNSTFIDNVEELDAVTPKYKLLALSNNYSITSGSLQNYYRDEMNCDESENDANENMVNNNKIKASKSFK